MIKCLAQEHNAVLLMSVEPATLQFHVYHFVAEKTGLSLAFSETPKTGIEVHNHGKSVADNEQNI